MGQRLDYLKAVASMLVSRTFVERVGPMREDYFYTGRRWSGV